MSYTYKNYTYKNPDVVTRMENESPDMANEFWRICHEQYETFCAKQLNYGKNNVLLGGDIDNEEDRKVALAGIAIRLADKSNRLLNLVVKRTHDAVGESVADTLQDMSNYAIIGQIIQNQRWR
jgi:hypothetical protein